VVETTAHARFRLRTLELSPRAFLRLALAATAALYVIVVTGATVRLTASGLGCEHWPGCTRDNPFPAKDYHAFIEFSNRLVGAVTIVLTLLAWLGSRRTPGLPRRARRLAALTFAGTLAQAPLGAITVYFDLHPLLVISHFLLSLVVLAWAVGLVLEARGLQEGWSRPLVPAELRRAGLVLVAACLALVVSGTLVTAAGPHSGGADVRRLGTVDAALWVHVRSTALFGCVFLFCLGYLAARRERSPRLFHAALGLLGLILVQMAVGEIQYRTELPWWLVLVHVGLAAGVWATTVALVLLFARPLRSLEPGAT
jgi:cytochrome c oxidase assembly protein subunit 15